MDIDAMARAMFDALHERFNRMRNWDRHPEKDVSYELGRESFRHMAQAVGALLSAPAPVEEAAPVEAAPVAPVEPPPASDPAFDVVS